MNDKDEYYIKHNFTLPKDMSLMVDRLYDNYPHLVTTREGLIAAYKMIATAIEQGGIFFICGNGGSFADAVHIKGELGKCFERPGKMTNPQVVKQLQNSDGLYSKDLLEYIEPGIPVLVLGESDSLRSAYINDRRADFCYAQELNAFASHIKQGALLAISTSGNSANVVAATELANAYGMGTISFTGPGGGELGAIAQVKWEVPGDCTADIQENQMPLYHCLCRLLEAHFHG